MAMGNMWHCADIFMLFLHYQKFNEPSRRRRRDDLSDLTMTTERAQLRATATLHTRHFASESNGTKDTPSSRNGEWRTNQKEACFAALGIDDT